MNSPTINRARALRRDQTPAERKRQEPVGPYYADFLCPEARLVVELDGGQHSTSAERDARRTTFLEAHGLRVIRFWNYEVIEDLDAVCATIHSACADRRPEAK